MVPRRDDEEEEEEERGVVPLPCFENATTIDLTLEFFGLALPSSGAFALLTELCLKRVRFQGPCELGDAVSSPRCPCLRKLSISDTRGLDNITIHSKSLLLLGLKVLRGLRQLTIVVPALKKLRINRLPVSQPRNL